MKRSDLVIALAFLWAICLGVFLHFSGHRDAAFWVWMSILLAWAVGKLARVL